MLHYQSTSPVRIRVEHCIGTIRVYRDGILHQIIETQQDLDRYSFFGNR